MQKKSGVTGMMTTAMYFNSSFGQLRQLTDPANTVILTDENIFGLHGKRFRNWKTIVLPPGEQYKVQATVDSVIDQLIGLQADRTTTLVGVGGGVVTDLTGYIASVYMRGVSFGFVPTSLLAMVDAAIGGKNGIDVGVYKNMVGTIRQPQFLLYDAALLKTLPEKEWKNGFAEIIKHALIKNRAMFTELEQNSLDRYRKKKQLLEGLIQANARIKTKVVQSDPYEMGERKLLNFGHTLGHALENTYRLSHGEAVAAGMNFAARLSETETGFKNAGRVTAVLEQYGLPATVEYEKEMVIDILKMDKKRAKDRIRFVLLERIGKALIHDIPITRLSEIL